MNIVDEIAGTLGDNIVEMEIAPTFETFLEWAADYILDDKSEITPHGEYGGHEHSLIFKYNDSYYLVKVDNISWNRHDKMYYYLEMWEKPNIICTEISPALPENGIIDDEWENTGSKVLDGKKILIEDDVFYPQDSLKFSGGDVTIQDVLYIKERLKVKGYAENQFKFDVLI